MSACMAVICFLNVSRYRAEKRNIEKQFKKAGNPKAKVKVSKKK